MKSERRHELHHNWLADQMTKVGKAIGPYANVLLGGAVLIAIIAVGWTVMAKKSSAEATHAWEDLYAGMGTRSFTELNNVVERYPGSDAAQWAAIVVGDFYLKDGCDQRFTSRAGAEQQLTKAIEHYEAVLKAPANPTIRQRATLGLARANEAKGAADKAITFYKKLLEPKGTFTEFAEARIKSLENPTTKEFLAEFEKFDPKPVYREDQPGPLELDNLKNLDMPSYGEPLMPEYHPLDKGLPPAGAPTEQKPEPATE